MQVVSHLNQPTNAASCCRVFCCSFSELVLEILFGESQGHDNSARVTLQLDNNSKTLQSWEMRIVCDDKVAVPP